jgi:hypothetical protein
VSLAAVLTGLVLQLAPAIGSDRAAEVASGAAVAAEASPQPLEAGVLLIVTAWRESGFRKAVETCQITGDGGRAVTAYQLHREHWGHHQATEICADHALASRLALRALEGHHSVRGACAAFLGRRWTDPEVTRRVAAFNRLLAAARAHEGES